MANSTTLKYGDYNFVPVPFITLNKTQQKNASEEVFGSSFSVTLNGTLTQLPTGAASIITIDGLQDELLSAFSTDGKQLLLKCGAEELLNVYPRINSVDFEPTNDNWTWTTAFNISLEFYYTEASNPFDYHISDASEEWSLEFDDSTFKYTQDLSAVDNPPTGETTDTNNSRFILTHSVSAVGKPEYTGSGPTGSLTQYAWKNAREYVVARLTSQPTTFDTDVTDASGVINLDSSFFGGDFSIYNHRRNQQINEGQGSFAVTESWFMLDSMLSGTAGKVLGPAIEDFTTTTRNSLESDITTVAIEGTIEGLETVTYLNDPGDFIVVKTKYERANTYWNNLQDRLLARVEYVGSGEASRSFNITPTNISVGHSPTRGTISYSYEYNDRPSNCVTGSLSESIVLTDNNPADVFASLVVIGRTAGPILQDIGTKTERTRDFNIEVLMPPSTGCSYAELYGDDSTNPREQIKETLLCPMETEMVGSQDQVFVRQDNESWTPKTGRYTRGITWVFSECDDDTTPGACATGTNMDVV